MTSAPGDMLRAAVSAYDFPAVTYDFSAGREIRHPSIQDVEQQISGMLVSSNLSDLRNGLSNVLYWGFARVGYRDVRVKTFRDTIRDDQLQRASQLFQRLSGSDLRGIAKLELPQFSGMSFVSKVRMFLDPTRYAVLDRKLLSLRSLPVPTIFQRISMGPSEQMIRISSANEQVYEAWCEQCRRLAQKHLRLGRAVDIERAIFYLIDTGHANAAAEILHEP